VFRWGGWLMGAGASWLGAQFPAPLKGVPCLVHEGPFMWGSLEAHRPAEL
jgi:hypothetical protein